MTKSVFVCAAMAAAASMSLAQQPRPPRPMPAETSVTIAGKTITIKYSAPHVAGRQMFGPGGVISHDKTYPVWRAGANAATALHTDADLDIKGLHVPAGNYTLFANVENPDQWEFIVSKATGEWGLAYDKSKDLGSVKMDMSKPGAPVEVYKMTLSSTGEHTGKLVLAFDDHEASVPFTVK
ncbi:MAG TPA: DUF2911 domain-containing protein [Bryobacteraceae bacterium]|nr:DUF2911 domain-containing protein [Bryobacteraceae bacterium]